MIRMSSAKALYAQGKKRTKAPKEWDNRLLRPKLKLFHFYWDGQIRDGGEIQSAQKKTIALL